MANIRKWLESIEALYGERLKAVVVGKHDKAGLREPLLAQPDRASGTLKEMMMEKSRWQQEFEALPGWAQSMVRALQDSPMYGVGSLKEINGSDGNAAFVGFKTSEAQTQWFDGFTQAKALADALTAPWPQPMPEPHEEMTSDQIVEASALIDGDDCAFDQPCHFGHRVDGHAVYCHNDAWPSSPRKCRRNRIDYRHEDCPGFYLNNLWRGD